MIKKLLLALLLMAIPYPVAHAKNTNWSIGTAHTIEKGRYEVGVFQPLRYGLNDSLEISSHALTALISPNVEIKKGFFDEGRWSMAFTAFTTYPTHLLRAVACQGSGCILPADISIPHILAGGGSWLVTAALSQDHRITQRLELREAFAFGDNEMPTVDLPLLYTRMAHYHEGISALYALDFDGLIWGNFHYSLDAEVWWMPEREENLAVEHALLLSWRPSDTFSLEAGYKYIWGEYPFGTDWHLLPLLDAQWAF